ncbi:hypothetical protein BH23ACT9_BH23ACT9_34260 [soil metagenome]
MDGARVRSDAMWRRWAVAVIAMAVGAAGCSGPLVEGELEEVLSEECVVISGHVLELGADRIGDVEAQVVLERTGFLNLGRSVAARAGNEVSGVGSTDRGGPCTSLGSTTEVRHLRATDENR